jgi:hypothetical protein
MATQDEVRENKLVDLFNLDRPENRTRHGVDALLHVGDITYEFELKSITSGGGLTTVRDFGRDHIEKWKAKHWIVGVFSGTDLILCRYGSPPAMAPWIAEKWEYIRPDMELARIAPERLQLEDMYAVIGRQESYSFEDAKRLHKKQYSVEKYIAAMDGDGCYSPAAMLEIFRHRLRYVIERGSTLNNPKVSPDYLAAWPTITSNHAAELRVLVEEWRVKASA